MGGTNEISQAQVALLRVMIDDLLRSGEQKPAAADPVGQLSSWNREGGGHREVTRHCGANIIDREIKIADKVWDDAIGDGVVDDHQDDRHSRRNV